MIAQAIEKIIDLKRPELLEIEGKPYRINGYKPVLEEYPPELTAKTLTSIVDFFKNRIDGWGVVPTEVYVHIEDQDTVSLKSVVVGAFNQRITLVRAEAITTDFRFKQDYDMESFIIAVNSQFKPAGDRDYLLKIVSNLTAEASQNISDTGVSQAVTVKKGITMKETVDIKNPISLQPYRTFSEVEQPESQFVFRISSNRGIECSLHPCDGAAWKLEAIQNIKGFFETNLPSVPVIA